MTEADAGKSVPIQRGNLVEVRLQNTFGVPGSSTRWDASSTDSSVLKLTGSQHQ